MGNTILMTNKKFVNLSKREGYISQKSENVSVAAAATEFANGQADTNCTTWLMLLTFYVYSWRQHNSPKGFSSVSMTPSCEHWQIERYFNL